MAQRSRKFIILVVTAATLLMISFCNCSLFPHASPSAPIPISTAANSSPYTVNISGYVTGTDHRLIIADFRAELFNTRTTLLLLSESFSQGIFTVPILIPRDAIDNDTFRIRILSLDKSTIYGEENVTLNDTAHSRNFTVDILVVNPPPNYNGIILFAILMGFTLILAISILFMRRSIDMMAAKRTDEIMIERRMGKKGGDV